MTSLIEAQALEGVEDQLELELIKRSVGSFLSCPSWGR